jgi:nitroimidazol reductase NimA-like FMN-containing flavoprotein (pyridoxamine 5'-phosphate oxidase superfamily)
MLESTELTYDECRAHLEGGALGRVAMSTPVGPRIIPVNYTVADSSIVFRTTPYSLLGTYARNTILAFEVDHFDASHEGWSVVAIGRATMIEDLDELNLIRAQWDPAPWPAGQRRMYFRMAWRELTGRCLGLAVPDWGRGSRILRP